MGIYLNPSTENFGNLGLSHNGASLLEQPSTKTIKSEAILKCRNKNAIRENGMTNCDFRSMDDLKDPVSHFVYDLLYSDAQIDGILHCLPAVICGTIKYPFRIFDRSSICSCRIPRKLAFSFIKYGARDHARVPMQWDDSVNAGFNKGTRSWQCVNPSYTVIILRGTIKWNSAMSTCSYMRNDCKYLFQIFDRSSIARDKHYIHFHHCFREEMS